MNRYEALIALNTKGKEETIKDTIERVEKLLQAEGASIEQVQRLEKRELSYESNHVNNAYYVNYIFAAAPDDIDKMRAKLKLESEVLLQNYLKLAARKEAVAA